MRPIKTTFKVTGAVAALGLGGCGIFTTPAPLFVDQIQPDDIPSNNVADPDADWLNINQYCNDLLQKVTLTDPVTGKTTETLKPIPIPVRVGDKESKLILPQSNEPSAKIMTNESVKLDGDLTSGIVKVSDVTTNQTTQEIDVINVSSCQGAPVPPDDIASAKKFAQGIRLPPLDQIYIARSVVHRIMNSTAGKAIDENTKGAVTPIVNVNGQNYSMSSQVSRTHHFIMVFADQANAQPLVESLSSGTQGSSLTQQFSAITRAPNDDIVSISPSGKRVVLTNKAFDEYVKRLSSQR